MTIAEAPSPVMIEPKPQTGQVAPSSHTDWHAWIADFTARHGRRPRILHVGNIANNGYNNAKVLVEAGFECHALCYDYYHIMGCPEWEDADFTGMVSDHFAPNWREVNLQGFTRPRWFAQGPRLWAVAYLLAALEGRTRRAGLIWRILAVQRYLIAMRTTRLYKHLRVIKPVAHGTQTLFHTVLATVASLPGRAMLAARNSLCWALRLPSRTLSYSARRGQTLRQRVSAKAGALHARLDRLESRFCSKASRFPWPIGPLAAIAVQTTKSPFFLVAFVVLLVCLPFALLIRPALYIAQHLALKLSSWADRIAPAPSDAARQHQRQLARLRRRDFIQRLALRVLAGIELAALDTPEFEAGFNARTSELIADFARRFPTRKDQLQLIDMLPYRSVLPLWKHLFDHYDLVEAYATDPILTMLTGSSPFVAYEHGTIRDIPFADNATARLTALAYARADATIITNPDCIAAAQRLEIPRVIPIPHLIDRKYYDMSIADAGILPPGVCPPYVFSPARHDFDVKGTHILLEAFARIAPDFPDVQLVTPSWGADLDRSRELMRSLGIEHRVVMIEPLNIHNLIRVTRGARVLVDQFRYGVFGGIGPTALAVGTPLVTHLDHAKSDWCMEPPPYFEAHDIDSCAAALRDALMCDAAHMRATLHAWMRRNYWHGHVVERHATLFMDLISTHPNTKIRTPQKQMERR
ncbi:MAG: glycosyltransferase [Phycisphaeraceae bacterium]|nr:glycosyltransferase [Phycisphaeraceae bacterium]